MALDPKHQPVPARRVAVAPPPPSLLSLPRLSPSSSSQVAFSAETESKPVFLLQSPTVTPLPPAYNSHVPPVPGPMISGYLEKSTGDPSAGLKAQTWVKMYVEVSDGSLRFFRTREERNEASAAVIPLGKSYVSVQGKRHIRIESAEPAVRLFRAQSEARAYHWAFAIAKYSMIKPLIEGYCTKQSGRKKVMEERYLRLTQDGLLSWYKSESDEADCRGTIQVGGEGVSTNPDRKEEIWVKTKDRTYIFSFIDAYEASQWFRAIAWHTYRKPIDKPGPHVRNG